MKIAIADDDSRMLETARVLVEEYGRKHGLDIEITCFQQAADFIASLQQTRHTIVFMDIQFVGEEINGVDAARALRRVDPESVLIFLTDNDGYMPEAFSVHAFSYILKDRIEATLEPTLNDAMRLLPVSKILTISVGRQNVQLYFSDIMYACTDGHYINLTDVRNKEWRTRMTFSDLIEKLRPDDGFLAINKGIVVNMDQISAVRKRDCIMNDGHILPVRARNSAEIAQIWHNHVFDSMRREQRQMSLGAGGTAAGEKGGAV